ncbi:BRCT domain-containing protein [Phanerochaete sordida]|uniref:BRCT domain-containing protein n=1 Tax=Phanerochaete sordida TaxID=48140 RepID=A0A9P3G2D3_9APHY|nr:BRCT domain-containing protein [Phanerochaete sordida]
MGTFNDSVCTDDSQGSTSTTKGTLAGPTPASSVIADKYPTKDQNGWISCARDTQSSYSLHGLAGSPSQTSKEAALTRKESQKENTPAPVWQRSGTRLSQSPAVPAQPRTFAPAPRSGEDISMDNLENVAGPSNVRKTVSTSDKIAAAPRPDGNSSLPCTSLHDNAASALGAKGRAKALPSRSNNTLKRPRSPSPASEDSFAVLPKDIQEKKYVKQSKTFQMPLSELGRSQDSFATDEHCLDEDQDESPSFTSDVSRTRTRFRDLSVSRTGSEPPTQPQHSQRANSPFFYDSGAQVQDEDDELFPTNNATRASSSPRLHPKTTFHYSSDDASSGAATQLTDTTSPVATQPLDEEAPAPPIDAYHQSGATSTTTAPPSLLAMVNPRKRWRFQGNAAAYAQAQAYYEHTQTIFDSHEPAAGPSTYAETQPSEDSNLPDTGRKIDIDEDDPMMSVIEETQPSDASHLPDTGRLVDDSRFDLEEYVDGGATQPSDASHLPATGLRVDPSFGVQDHPPASPSVVPETEPSQPIAAPSSSPDVPLAASPVVKRPTALLGAIEEVDSESQEVPLAATSKPRTKPSSKPLSRDDSGSIMPPPPKRARTDPSGSKPSPRPAPAPSIRSEDMILQSSDPHEREMQLMMPTLKSGTKGKGKKGTPAPITPARSKNADPDDSDDHSAHDNDETRTEIADEDIEERSNSTRKRKQGPSSALRASTRSVRTNTSTPPTRGASRVKSASTARVSSATRVLALWKQDSHYYTGTVHAEESPGKYVVKFDDDTEDVVDLSKLRRLELRLGDYVLVKGKPPQKATVADASRSVTSDRQVLVRFDGDEGVEEEVETRDIMIPSRSVVGNWKDRLLVADEVVPLVRPKAKASPTPSRLAHAGSLKSAKRLFAKTGFLLTTAPGFADWDKARSGIEAQIRGAGGAVLDDWCRVFSMEGKVALGGKRWILEKGELRLIREELERVFLLSDEACHKPKFLIALALGIPCVKFDWLHDSVAEAAERDWQAYLLPAGTSETLNARITQMVDVDWGSCPDHLRDIMGNRVPSKLLHDLNILCVLQDVAPGKGAKRGSSDADRSREATRMIPRILLCMGAARVEAVDGLAHASTKLDRYDYVVVKDAEEVRRVAKARSLENCVAFPWVKECLITGRILPRE